MTRTEMLREAAVLLRNPATMGDGALLKSLALSDRGYRHAREALAPFAGFLADLDPAALARMPAGSFGRATLDFCTSNGITLLRPSRALAEASHANVVAVRYAATHDLVHVLIDEGADFAGEAAVYGWSCAQGYVYIHWVALVLGCVVWSLLRPWQAFRIVRGALRGWRKGRGAPLLLAQRFEDRLAEPLHSVRADLGLRPTPGSP
jgi:ubiquinone biosynthesis protein Coq4